MVGLGQRTSTLKFGFDIHGVIDTKLALFRELAFAFMHRGHEVHVISGPPKKQLQLELAQLNFPYTHLFSIVEYHTELGTHMRFDDRGTAHMDPYLWDKTKGEYCAREGIAMHWDDSDIYGYFFKTPYCRFYSKDTHRVAKIEI